MNDFEFDFDSRLNEAITRNSEYIAASVRNAIPENATTGDIIGSVFSASIITASKISAILLKEYHQELMRYLTESEK